MTETPTQQLTPAMLHILLALAGGARHGYRIMKEVSERTQGGMELGAGTLYRSIGKMLDAGWIRETEGDDSDRQGPKRREYELTAAGRAVAAVEVRQLSSILRWAADGQLIDPGEPA